MRADAIHLAERVGAWFQSFDGVPVTPVVQTIVRAVPIVSEAWRVPPQTPAEIAAEAERQRVIAEGKEQLKCLAGARSAGAERLTDTFVPSRFRTQTSLIPR